MGRDSIAFDIMSQLISGMPCPKRCRVAQWLSMGPLFKYFCKVVVRCLTIRLPSIAHTQPLDGILCIWNLGPFMFTLALACSSILMFIHASCGRAIIWPLSWRPLTWKKDRHIALYGGPKSHCMLYRHGLKLSYVPSWIWTASIEYPQAKKLALVGALVAWCHDQALGLPLWCNEQLTCLWWSMLPRLC